MYRKYFKRLLDILIAIVGSLILIPLSIYVYFKSPKQERKKGIFFVQPRIGKNGKKIYIYKYRTMIIGAEEILEKILNENLELKEEYEKNKKLKNDPRITGIGNFLRKTSLDEFPQFINVLKGEMSVIGPRPYLEREKNDMGIYYNNIIKLKPGITGLWQVCGRSETTFEERLSMDKEYLLTYSFFVDIKILLKTLSVVVFRKGAY